MIWSLGFLLISSSIVSGQWVRSFEESSLTPSVPPARFPSLMSVRSSEEEHLKSPLAHHLPSSSSLAASPSDPMDALRRIPSLGEQEGVLPAVEVVPSSETNDRPSNPIPRFNRNRQGFARRRTSGSSAFFVRRKQQSDSGNTVNERPARYEYSSRLPLNDYPVNQPAFIGFPIAYRRAAAGGSTNKKLYRKPHRITTSVRAESGRPSSNPPEVIPVESKKPLEVYPPKKFNPKQHKKPYGNKPASAAIHERETESTASERLIPDKHLGNDMLYYHENPNRRGIIPGNDVDNDDPNTEFVLIK